MVDVIVAIALYTVLAQQIIYAINQLLFYNADLKRGKACYCFV